MKLRGIHVDARVRVGVVALGTTLLGGGVALAAGGAGAGHTNRATVYSTTTTTSTTTSTTTTTTTVPPRDTTPPTISGVSITPARFAVAQTSTAVSARKKHRHKHAPKGATIRFTLSEPAAVGLAITQKLAGHQRGGRCVTKKSKHHSGHRCTLLTTVGGLTRASEPAGADAVAFSGRIGSRALKAGGYSLRIDAKDPSGNKAVPQTLQFTVVKG